jgi:hypothetical protein
METLRVIHNNTAWVVVALNLLVGIWGLVAWRRKGEVGRPYWYALGAAWASIYVHGMLGLAMFEALQPPFRHHFYGFLFAFVTLYVFATQRAAKPSRRLFAFSVATLFIGIVSIRATFSL